MVASPSGHHRPHAHATSGTPLRQVVRPSGARQAKPQPLGGPHTLMDGQSCLARSLHSGGGRHRPCLVSTSPGSGRDGVRTLDSGVLRPGAAVPVTLSCPEWVLVPVRISGRGRGLSRPSALGGSGACVLDPPVGNPPGEPTPLRRAAHSHRLVSLSPFGLFVAALGARVCVLGHANLYVTGMGKGRRVWHE